MTEQDRKFYEYIRETQEYMATSTLAGDKVREMARENVETCNLILGEK